MSSRKFQGKMTDVQLMNQTRVTTGGSFVAKAKLVLLDQDDFQSISELLSNETFQPVYIEGLSELDGYYYVTKPAESAKGGEKNVWTMVVTMEYAGDVETWNVSGEAVSTHWDTFEEWTTSDPNWWNESGVYSWSGSTGMALTNTERARSDEVELWDGNYRVIVNVEHNTSDADHAGILVRKAGKTSYDLCYDIQVDWGNDQVRFAIQNGGETILRTWDVDITYNTETQIVVDCKGNRFEVYCKGIFLGTIHDDTFRCGYIVFTNAAGIGTAYFNNTKIVHTKPVTASLPVGAADINQMRMAGTGQLNDDTTDAGAVNIIVAPDNPVEFKRSGSVYGGGEVKVYDTMGSTTESDWRRVYDKDRNFVGNIVIDNGLIRISLAGQNYIKDFIMSVYSDTSWENVTFNPYWSSLTFENVDYGITRLEKYIVILREASYWETPSGMDLVWTDYIMRSGSRMIEVENVRAL